MFVDESSVVYLAGWDQGGWLVAFPAEPKPGGCATDWNPPRAGMPSRFGKFVVQNESSAEWAILDHSSDPCNPKQVMLPAMTSGGQEIRWQAVSDGPWAVGTATGEAGERFMVRVDTRIVDPNPLSTAVVGPVETLGSIGFGAVMDVNDKGQIVGITGNPPTSTAIFEWLDGSESFPMQPPGGNCYPVAVNREGSLLAVCAGFAYVRMSGTNSWTKVISTNGGPVPFFHYPGRVNSKGQLVAALGAGNGDIVLWDSGNTVSLLANAAFEKGPPNSLMHRASINDKGQIGVLADHLTGSQEVYLISANRAYKP